MFRKLLGLIFVIDHRVNVLFVPHERVRQCHLHQELLVAVQYLCPREYFLRRMQSSPLGPYLIRLTKQYQQ